MNRRWLYGLGLLALVTLGELVYLRLWLGPEIAVEVVTVGISWVLLGWQNG
jgi:hypothetical protein